MKPYGIRQIKLANFKSIKRCELNLTSLNVLVGANGAGKSNLFGAFELLSCIVRSKLQWYVGKHGGPDAILHFGRKRSPSMNIAIQMYTIGSPDSVSYTCVLEPTNDNQLMFTEESFVRDEMRNENFQPGSRETRMWGLNQNNWSLNTDFFPIPLLAFLNTYHFQDTGADSPIKQQHATNINNYLRPDGSNLAAYLWHLEKNHNASYQTILKTIRLAAPFFKEFSLRPNPDNGDLIELEWLDQDGDTPFKAHHLSDGTLRFMCLATLLLQPSALAPSTIIIDEPELGLHPYAITLLAGMLRSASVDTQIIISTQSAALLDKFQPQDVIVVDRTPDGSSFKRLEEAELANWLEEYSLGELWNTNIFGGRPS